MTDLGSCSNCGKPRPADAAFVCPFCGRPYVSEKPPSSSSINAKALAGITWLTSAGLIGYLAYQQWTFGHAIRGTEQDVAGLASRAELVAIYGVVIGLVTLFFGVRVLWRTSRTLLTWSVVWAAVIVALGVLQILGLLQLGSRAFGDIVILATIAIGAAGLQSFVARQDMPATSQSAKDSVPPPVAPAVSPPHPPSGLTYTPPPGRPFAPPPPAPVATVVGGHVILAPPDQPVLVPGEDRTSPVLVLLAVLTGLLALTVVGYAVLARDGGLLAGAAPTPTPVVAPTPARSMRLVTPPPFVDTVPLTFGVEYDPESLVIVDPADEFRVGVKEIAWNASLRQPAGVTSLTLQFARLSDTGAEVVLLSESIPLSDEAAMTVAATADLSNAAKHEPGTYVVRLLRGAVVLAEGTFTLVK